MDNKKLVGILTERDFVRVVERVGTFLERSLAKDHMTSPVFTVQSDAPLAEVTKLMAEKHVRHIIVLNKKREVAGIISSRDIMKATKEDMTI
jgi:CBS domain-containing protein